MKLGEFAKLLGLSQTTVSRALGGYPEVSEKTRKRVLAAAKQHGYRPNAAAQSLVTGTIRTIGCVIPITEENQILNPIFTDFLAGVGEACARRNFEIALKVVYDGAQEETYRSIKSSSSIGGVIIQSPRVSDDRLALLEDIGLPYIVHGRSSAHKGAYSWVDVNNDGAFERCAEYLTDLGHRDIALINGREDFDFAARRKTGFLNGLEAAGCTYRPELARSVEMTATKGYQQTRELLDLPDPPSAIIASSLMLAWGAQQALDERGLKIGRDVSVAVFDDVLAYLGNTSQMPSYTAMRSSVRDAGIRLAEILIAQIDSGDFSPVQELLEPDLVIGRSTGRLR